MDLFKVG